MNGIALTGASGFVGSVVRRILKLPDSQCFDIVTGHDLNDETTTDTIIQRADTIIHLGALSGVAACDRDKEVSSKTNHLATVSLARKLKEKPGIKRFIFASSASVYGEAQSYLMDELHPTEPRSHYGLTKLNAEEIMSLASQDFQVIILRPSNIYGYGITVKEGSVLSLFLKAHIENRPITISGSGSQKRDFVHVVDVSRLYARLATAPTIRSGIYNVGGNETVSMRALAQMVNDVGEAVLGYRVPIEFKPDPNESLYHDFKYSSERAKNQFQYEPKIDLKYAITEKLLMHLRRD